MKTYYEKLKDPRWQRKRLEIMQRDGFSCQLCGDDEETLNVHHEYYVKGRSPWEYPAWSLKTLCADCHNDEHADDLSRDEVPYGIKSWEEIVGFLSGGSLNNFDDWWDISAMLAMRHEEFLKRGIRPIDWMMWAYDLMAKHEYLSALPPWECAACKDPMPDHLSPPHTCREDSPS